MKKIIIIILSILLILCVSTVTFKIIKNYKIEYISTYSLPYKIEYYVGEDFNCDGLVVKAYKGNGQSLEVELDECTFNGFDSSKVDDSQLITIKYKEFECSFHIKIKEKPQLVNKVTKIEIVEYPKIDYTLEEFQYYGIDVTGGKIRCIYLDGSESVIDIKREYVYGVSNISSVGTYELTIKYKENGIVVSTTYTITIF